MKRFTQFLTALVVVALFMSYSGLAKEKGDDITEQLRKALPELCGANNVGTDFWISNPPAYEETAGNNFVKLFITSPVKTNVTVEVPGKGYFKVKPTIPNDVIAFDIMPAIGQVKSKALSEPPFPEKVYKKYGLHIYADDPIVVYCIVRFQATSDGYLAIPTAALGKEYIVAAYDEDPMFYSIWQDYFPSTTCIIAPHDDTRVRFTLGGNVYTETAGGLKPGESDEARLMQGDVWMFMGNGANADLTGSRIVANKPVAVVSGNMCTNIPAGNQWCDYTVEMQLPTSVWGKDYHVGNVPGRLYPSLMRVFAKEPGTTIYRDGQQITYIPDVGGTEGKAWQEMRVSPMGDNIDPKSSVISGDKPIGVTLYNTGVEEDGYPLPDSDPFTEVQTPLEQYQTEITFCTPGTFGGDGFRKNWLNLIFQTNDFGMVPDELEFAEVQAGKYSWTPLNIKFSGAGELFSYDVDGKKFAMKTLSLSPVGVYKIRSKERPFAAYSFGYDWCDSYGYPTSAALADLEKPDTINPDPDYIVNCDGTIEGTIVTDLPEDDSIRSNMMRIWFVKDSSFNTSFNHEPFIPGEAETVEWELKIDDITEDARAVIQFMDRAGNDTTIDIKYFAIKLDILPDEYDFGRFKKGEMAVHDFKVVNLSETAPVKLTETVLRTVRENLDDQHFELLDMNEDPLTEDAFPVDLFPNGSEEGPWEYPFKVKFTAEESGEFRDSIGTGDTCFFWYKAFVQAEVGNPVINANSADYGRITVNTQSTKTVQVWNEGETELVITGHDGPFNPEYTTNDLRGYPWTLAPGEAKNINVTFRPTQEIVYRDSIIFFNDATEIDSVIELIGEGMKPGLEANSYDWDRRTIDRAQFPAGPYDYDGADPTEVITLSNTGSQEVRINSVTITGQKTDAFEIYDDQGNLVDPLQVWNGYNIPAGETRVFPVKFHPTELGVHEMKIVYNSSADNDPETNLAGIGIAPRITATPSVDFGTTIKDDYTDIKTPDQRVIFRNEMHQADGVDVSDTLTIFSFDLTQPNAIATDLTTWGSQGFRFDQTAVMHYDNTDQQIGEVDITQEITLGPGEYLEFFPEFVAQHAGAHTANVLANSDGLEITAVTDFNGNGIVEGAIAYGDETDICVGVTDEITATFENTGAGDLEVTSVSFDPVSPYFSFRDPDDANGFTVPEGESVTVPVIVEFPPSDQSVVIDQTYQVDMVFETDAIDPTVQEIRLDADQLLEGTPRHYDDVTSDVFMITDNITNETRPGNEIFVIQKPFEYIIALDDSDQDGNDFSKANVQSLIISVVYQKNFMNVRYENNEPKIELGDLIEDNFEIVGTPQITEYTDPDNPDEENLYQINVSIEATGNNFLMGTGPLLVITFDSFLPWYDLEEQDGANYDRTSTVSYEINTKNACLDIEGGEEDIRLNEVCVYDMRQIVVSDQAFALQQIEPNPVGSNGGSIKFNVGLDVFTKIDIINANGEVVATPVAKTMDPGTYEIPIPVENLSSGVYMCRMASGPYNKTVKMVVVK